MAGCIDLSKKRLKKFKELLLEAPEWDENKRLLVMQKHDVDFRTVARVFEGNLDFVDMQVIPNSMEEYGEVRESFMGEVDGVVYFGVFTRLNNDYRLITAREANRRERPRFYDWKDRKMREKIEEKRDDFVDEIDYFPEYDPSKVISVQNRFQKEFHKEVLTKGYDKIKRRLKKEGYKFPSGGYVYSPPGYGTKK